MNNTIAHRSLLSDQEIKVASFGENVVRLLITYKWGKEKKYFAGSGLHIGKYILTAKHVHMQEKTIEGAEQYSLEKIEYTKDPIALFNMVLWKPIKKKKLELIYYKKLI